MYSYSNTNSNSLMNCFQDYISVTVQFYLKNLLSQKEFNQSQNLSNTHYLILYRQHLVLNGHFKEHAKRISSLKTPPQKNYVIRKILRKLKTFMGIGCQRSILIFCDRYSKKETHFYKFILMFNIFLSNLKYRERP